MKNIIQRGVCLLLLLAVTAALSACGQSGAKNTIYAVEAVPPARRWPRKRAGPSTVSRIRQPP